MSSNTPPSFDPNAYKSTTRAQWEEAADAWHRWAPALEAWLGGATERMLDLAAVAPGSRVLDVAAGAGGQSLVAARRAGPEGSVLATDISPAILAFAAAEASRAGLTNLQTQEVDGEELDLEPGSFDAAISRVGLIYFPDQQAALQRIRRALRPGGRFATITYTTADRNGFFSVPIGIVRQRAQLPPPLPGQPGPFSLGAPGVLEETLTKAGFVDVEVQTVDAPLRFPTAADLFAFERESFGALHQMLSGLDEAGRAAAWDEIARALEQFAGPDGVVAPCELLVGGGRRPD